MVPLTFQSPRTRKQADIRPVFGDSDNGTQEQVRPSEHIQALVCGYAKENRDKAILVILQGYFDESASEQGEKLIVVAGYIHQAAIWAFFSDDWKLALDAAPAIEYFHMVEAESLRGQFKGWGAKERNAKVNAMADVIEKYKPWSICCSVSQTKYRDLVASVAPYDLRVPYLACFQSVVIKLAQWHASRGIHAPLDFIFDERGFSPGEVAFFFESARESVDPAARKLLGGLPIFRDDKKILPLQAADMLAWHIRREKEQRNSAEDRPVMDKLLPDLHAEAHIRESDLRNMARDILRVPNRGFTTKKKDSIRKILRSVKPGRYKI